MAIVLSGLLYAEPLNNLTEDNPAVSVVRAGSKGFTLRIEFPPPEFSSSVESGSDYTKVEIPGCGFTSELGKAELPAFTKLIRLPRSGGYSIKIIPGETRIYRGKKIVPAQELQVDGQAKPEFRRDEEFYAADKFYPEALSEKGEIAIWRELRVAPVTVYPVKYNPVSGELSYMASMEVEITYTPSGENEQQPVSRPLSEAFAELYSALSIGPEGSELDSPVDRGALLIITPPQYTTQLAGFVDWKTRMGYETHLATTNETGTTTTTIKNYISNAYNTWSKPPEYVILIGDEDSGMPCFYIPGYYNPYDCEDWEYTLLEGNDYFPEVLIGRISVDNTSQLTAYLNKIDSYEKSPYVGQTAWYQRALMIADYSGAESTRYTKEFCEDQCLYGGYTTVENAYYPGSQTGMISEEVNQGVSLVNYRGYGGNTYWTMNTWSQWGVSNVANLNNGLMLPVVTSMVCGGGNFAYSSDPGFGEAWIREANKGGIVFCGPSEVSTHTKWNNNLDCGLYWGIFREGINQFAPALLYAKMELWLDYPHNRSGIGSSSNSVGFYFYVYNILGDPSLRMWNTIPQNITVQYVQPLTLGVNHFDVTVTNSSGQPIEDAYVCIWKGSEVYEGAPTDEAGTVSLPMENYSAGTMKLTVTGKSLKPFLMDVIIAQADVIVGIDSLVVDDDNIGGSAGNSDGMVSPGESIDLQITVKNYGNTTTAQNVIGQLSSGNSKVHIVTTSHNFGNISPLATAAYNYRITLDENLTAEDDLDLNLNLISSQGSWLQTVWTDISDAEFLVRDYNYTPAVLQPGEQATLVISVENVGLCDASGVFAELVSSDTMFQVISGNGFFGNILSGAQGSNATMPFTVEAASTAFPGRIANLTLNFTTSEGYEPVSPVNLVIGQVAVTDPLGPDAYGYYCFDSFDADYSKRPTYSWVELHGGLGTQLNLPDYGNEQDAYVTANLPFTFQFYGQDITQISVCSNGFISMGNNDFVDFRNKAIPSAIGAPNMIAGFWDDLYLSSGTSYGKVYKYSDTANHRFIIEWWDTKNEYTNSLECFEIILYDPAYWPTPTGDGEILIQYEDINDNDADDNYSTVGIENWDHSIGMEYVFSDIYPAASHELQDGLAILFTTDPGGYNTILLDITYAPIGGPIQIPASGGSFQYTAGAANIGATAAVFDFWTEVTLPTGSTMSPLLLRPGLSLNPGGSLTRTMTQVIPAGAPAGNYMFRGNLGNYATLEVYDWAEFPVVKLGD